MDNGHIQRAWLCPLVLNTVLVGRLTKRPYSQLVDEENVAHRDEVTHQNLRAGQTQIWVWYPRYRLGLRLLLSVSSAFSPARCSAHHFLSNISCVSSMLVSGISRWFVHPDSWSWMRWKSWRTSLQFLVCLLLMDVKSLSQSKVLFLCPPASVSLIHKR